jgi:hypothetical protein
MEFWSLKNRDVKSSLLALTDSGDKVQAHKAERILELVRYLEEWPPSHRALAILHLTDQLWITFGRRPKVASARIRIDWKDYGPVEDGIPIMHYRIEVKTPGDKVWSEIRTRELEEIRQFLARAVD